MTRYMSHVHTAEVAGFGQDYIKFSVLFRVALVALLKILNFVEPCSFFG